MVAHIAAKDASLINYGERYRSGERISSAFVEATVNAVISKRFAKKQQMQWSRTGAHLLLQTRTQPLDGSLRSTFEKWYPGMANDNHEPSNNSAALPHNSSCSPLQGDRRRGRTHLRSFAITW